MTHEEQTGTEQNEQDVLAFILMPFGDEFDHIYKNVVAPALESAGFCAERADSRLDQQNILKDIVRGIDRADLIVAELTSLAPNVLYELGIAHGLLKPTVLLTQDLEQVPFDLRSYRIVVYSTHYRDVHALKEKLADIATKHRNGLITFGNPVGDFAPSVVEGRVAIEPRGSGGATAEPRETTKREEAEAGLLDFVVEGLDASGQIAERLQRIGDFTQESTQKMTGRTAELQSIGGKGKLGNAARVHKVAAHMSFDLTQYAGKLQGELPGLRSDWERLAENMTGFLSIASIEREEDRDGALKLKKELTNSLDVLREFLGAVQASREAIAQMRGLSRDLNRAVTATERALDGLIDEVSLGESYMARMLNLLSQRLE